MVLRSERSLHAVPDWLHDDTEESIVGTEWHQEAIGELADMLREVGERRGETWGVCEQIELRGLYRQDGTPYAPRPDIMVLARPLEGFRSAVSLSEAGAPLFVCEVISASTARADREGKRTAYAAAGIPEYLIYDTSGDLLGQPFEGWRLPDPAATAYVPWEPDADGYWSSHSLHVSFGPTQPVPTVRDRDGTVIESSRSARRALRALQGELTKERAARAYLEEQIRLLRERLGE